MKAEQNMQFAMPVQDYNADGQTNAADMRPFLPGAEEIREKHEGLVKWQQDPSEVIERQIQYLRGYKWDMKRQEWAKTQAPLISDEGVHKLLTLINPFASHITIMGKTSEEQLRQKSFNLRRLLRCWIALGMKKYGIAKMDKGILLESNFQTMMSAVNRSVGGGDRSYSAEVTKFVDSAKPEWFQKPSQKVTL